jgi:homoserine dehydrogenase
MTTKVGLMGFGRIGRNLFRILYKRDDIQVTATATLAWFPGTTTSGAIPTAALMLSSASDSSAEAGHSSSR